MWQSIIGELRSDVNIEPKLKLVTTYNKVFVVQLLWKNYECSISLIFFEPEFLWFLSQGIQHFY